jgi:hypothetical protein
MNEQIQFWIAHAKTNTEWVRIFLNHARQSTGALHEDVLQAARFRMKERRWARRNLLKAAK